LGEAGGKQAVKSESAEEQRKQAKEIREYGDELLTAKRGVHLLPKSNEEDERNRRRDFADHDAKCVDGLRLLLRVHQENEIAETVDSLGRKGEIDGSRRLLAEIEEFRIFGQANHAARNFIFKRVRFAALHVLPDG